MPDKKAEGFETCRMGESGESGKRGIDIHTSELSDALTLVNSYRKYPMNLAECPLLPHSLANSGQYPTGHFGLQIANLWTPKKTPARPKPCGRQMNISVS